MPFAPRMRCNCSSSRAAAKGTPDGTDQECQMPGPPFYRGDTIFSSPALASTVTPFLDAPMPRTN
jgi:hypothetical protein